MVPRYLALNGQTPARSGSWTAEPMEVGLHHPKSKFETQQQMLSLPSM